MSRQSGAALLALTCAMGGVAGVRADGPQPPATAKGTSSADLFGLTKVHELHLEFSAKEWAKLQAVRGGMPFPGGPGGFGVPGRAAVPPDDEPIERHKGSGFGLEFPWAHGALTAEGKTYKDLGIRYKGNASYMASARGLKRNLKLDFDRYDDTLRFHGLKTLNLNAGAMDPTRAREVLSYAIFRAAGVPAPRTAFAQVTLTVPGKYDKELLGLYTVVEQVDRTFLKDRFRNGKGLLMKPERLRGLEYLGDDWERYKARYQPKHEPTREQAQRVIDFARLVNHADDEHFRKEIGAYLDVDEFLRFLAVNALLVNLDSFFMLGHNYYLYLNPETNRFVFIPWDLDLSLASFPLMGSPDQQLDLSLTHPYAGPNPLVDRLLADKDVSAKYQRLLKELSETCFAKEQLLRQIDAIEQVTKDLLAREGKAAAARKEGAGGFGFGPPGGGPFGRSPSLRTFAEKRTESVTAQLAGKRKGYVPMMGFGPGGFGPGGPGGFGGLPQPGQVLSPALQGALRLTAEQKKQLEELQKEVDGKLGKILTDDQKKRLKELREAPGRGGPPGGFGPPGFGPPAFGPPGGRPGEPKKDDKQEENKP
jgi:hypothetical protein